MSNSSSEQFPRRGLVTLCIMLATIMQVLDTTIANVALPHMQGSLSATQDQIVWVLTSYIVASAIMTLPTGWLAGRFGRKRIYTLAIAGFTFSSLLCGIASSIEEMVLFRVLQGCFGASMVPLAQSTLLDINPKEKHGSAMALWGVGVMIGPILGPTLGGWLTENYNWRWVFFINLPLGVISFLVLFMHMPDSERIKRPFDKFGFVTLSLMIGCLQLFLDRGESADWFSSREIWLYCALAGASLWMYLIHSRQEKHPFLTPAMFVDRNFVTSLFFIFFTGIILLATMALLPPYLQNLMGYPVLDVGILMAPRGVGTMIAMMIVGRLVNTMDPRVLILFGLAMTVLSLNYMTGFSTFVPAQMLVWSGALQGFGLGFIFVPLSTIAYATLEPHYRTEAASVFSLVRNIGSSIGISLVMVVLGRNAQINGAYLSELVTPFTAGLAPELLPQSVMQQGGEAALSLLGAEIGRQAMTIAYVNDFKLMMWIVLASAPLVLLLKNPRHSHAVA
ncbi:MAG: DHA2 family efflux MFS transporter permease subunit [Pseudomonadales bacterium]|nr:DHA2 family efflux MFS transporter permease subunit [Pseudomonadales bacterium]